jgi:hypothetical protein
VLPVDLVAHVWVETNDLKTNKQTIMKTNNQPTNSIVSPKVMSYIKDKPRISIKICFFIVITKQNM